MRKVVDLFRLMRAFEKNILSDPLLSTHENMDKVVSAVLKMIPKEWKQDEAVLHEYATANVVLLGEALASEDDSVIWDEVYFTIRNDTLGGAVHFEMMDFILDAEYITAMSREELLGDNEEHKESAWAKKKGIRMANAFRALAADKKMEIPNQLFRFGIFSRDITELAIKKK